MSSPRDCHAALTKFLASRNDQIYDIHFLPDGFGDLLHEGNEIGISKKTLVQCFIKARQIFFNLPIETVTQDSKSSNQQRSAPEIQIQHDTPHTTYPAILDDSQTTHLLLQTEILLLLDTEHLTACNWRKRRICALQERQSQCPTTTTTTTSSSPTSTNQYLAALHSEIAFTTTILRSPLHRHTKSPVLWFHRKWVMTQLLDVYSDALIVAFAGSHHLPEYDVSKTAESSSSAAIEHIINYEVSIVLQAGAHHPKNYYAFSYLREFMGLFANALAQGGKRSIRLQDLAKSVVETVHTWCLTYSRRRDISAWSFLLWLLEAMGDGDDNEDASELCKIVIDKTAHLGEELSWEGEGLWIFVDLAASRFGVDVEWLMKHALEKDKTAQQPTIGDDDANVDVTALSHKRWKLWVNRMEAAQNWGSTVVVANDDPS
ncbi:hypothetical protein AJ79_06053 [Helicocarpus griseus UAMH5409]|uniref:Uncharacterized protein n=1 Tax=Helicocarpus griseus UAMH5409 TaxID=1447875 RepID=A0A2B7XHZ5_9EURO|nr:hypothetical protein AJ79_06053 [Helicocarpus griseus UAMH5409]